MKKLLCMVFLALSLATTAAESTKASSAHISNQEMRQDTAEIEREVKSSFKKSFETQIEQAIATTLNNNQLDAAQAYMVAIMVKRIMNYMDIDVAKVHYISDYEADVTLRAKFPDIGNGDYSNKIEEKFRRKAGISIEGLSSRNLSDKEAEKYLGILAEAINESIDDILSNAKRYQYTTDVYRFVKVGNNWQTNMVAK